MHARLTDQDFHFGTQLMKESSRFESALTAADNDDPLIGEAGQILRFGGMCCECARDVVKRSRPGGEGRDAAGDDDAGSEKVASILKSDLEVPSARLDAGYAARINVRYGGALIPQSVIDEAFEGDRSGEVIPTAHLVSVQREGGMGVGDMGSRPSGTSSIPAGMAVRQKRMGSPKIDTLRPVSRRKWAAASP